MSKVRKILVLSTAFFMTGWLSTISFAASENDCGRECLDTIIHNYLTAITQHDVDELPISNRVKITSNAQAMSIDDDIWGSVSKLKQVRVAIDVSTGNVAAQFFVEDQGLPIIALVRLKVEAGEITEIESVVAKQGNLGDGEGEGENVEEIHFDPNGYIRESQPQWAETIPIGSRQTREGLIEVANTYFYALNNFGSDTFKLPPFAEGCDRFENGLVVTNAYFSGHPPSTCGGQFLDLNRMMSGGGGASMGIPEARYPVVDVEKGIALGFTLMPSKPGKSILLADMFKIVNQEIQTLQITYNQIEEVSDTGW